jgi:SOS-response transcriptional repressor LexA
MITLEEKIMMLKDFFKQKSLTQKKVAEITGMTQPQVSQLLSGKDPIGKKTAKLWSDCFGISYTWLLTGEGVMMKDQTVRPAKPGEGVPVYDIGISDKGVPFIGDTEHVNAGPLAGFGEGIAASDITDYVLLPMLKHREGDFAVRTRGRSMIDTRHPDQNINDGAIICVRPWHERHIQWGEIYCIATTDGYAVKRLMPSQNDNVLRCVSSNEEEGYLPYDVPTADIKGIGKVTAIINLQLL